MTGAVQSQGVWEDGGLYSQSSLDHSHPVLVSLPSPLHPRVFLPVSVERDFSKIPIAKGHDLITFQRPSRPSCGAGRPLPLNSLPASHHWFSPTRRCILVSLQFFLLYCVFIQPRICIGPSRFCTSQMPVSAVRLPHTTQGSTFPTTYSLPVTLWSSPRIVLLPPPT